MAKYTKNQIKLAKEALNEMCWWSQVQEFDFFEEYPEYKSLSIEIEAPDNNEEDPILLQEIIKEIFKVYEEQNR